MDLRCGRWEDALAGEICDALITDPPYGERVHDGHDAAVDGDHFQRELSYEAWGRDDVACFVESWSPRTRGWMCAMTSHDLIPYWEESFTAVGRYAFAPLPCVMRGMSVRRAGDGPSSWSVWLMVARPRTKQAASWGTLPGAYLGVPGHEHIGGKPEWLMRAIVSDYSRPGDIVCDPCAGGATTLIAASGLGRHAIGAEMDPETYAKAQARIKRGVQHDLFAGTP